MWQLKVLNKLPEHLLIQLTDLFAYTSEILPHKLRATLRTKTHMNPKAFVIIAFPPVKIISKKEVNTPTFLNIGP